jgi:hypothetical protein
MDDFAFMRQRTMSAIGAAYCCHIVPSCCPVGARACRRQRAESMPAATVSAPSPRLGWLIVALTVIGVVRAALLWAHEPLLAYANSYDQTRYSACFDIYPDRPASVPPEQNSPQAPYSTFRFIGTGDPLCYWSSELAFGALAAGLWSAAQVLGGSDVHSVRVLGALKLAAMLLLSIALSRAWWRRGDAVAALANAAVFALLLADPGNTLYLNTFYAEWNSLLAAYALFGSLLLWHAEPPSRARIGALALAALWLATSKIQHLVLPLALALALFGIDALRHRRIGWRALAVLGGAVVGLVFQVAQLQRDGALMDSIRQYNRADVVFTALLPLTEDKPAFLAAIGVDPACAVHSGKNAWMLPAMPERACPGVLAFGYVDELRVLAGDPWMSLRLAGRAVQALSPWLAANIGHVEGRDLGRIPSSVPTLGTPLAAWPWLQLGVLAAPLVALALARRRSARANDHALLTVVAMAATLAVTVLGDGLADTAKQGHLAVNAALAWLIVTSIGLAVRGYRRARRLSA